MGEKNGFLPYPKGFSTALCHFAQNPEQWPSSPIVPPIFTSETYALADGNIENKDFIIGKWGNPTRNVLEKLLAHLENGKYARVFPCGSAATANCLALLNQKDHVICLNDIYDGTRQQLKNLSQRYGIETTYIDSHTIENFENAVKPNSKMIWIETPTNPLLQVVDIKAVSKVAKRNSLILIVDNTFLTLYLQKPLNFGADISLHSVSKYINGHNDVMMGAIITNNEKLFTEIKSIQNRTGNSPTAFECSQVLRGLKTLPLRLHQQSRNSLEIAKFLKAHPKVEKVIHLGLPNHPNYELSKKQTSGFNGMLTIYLKGDLKSGEIFIKSLKIFKCAASLGGYISVVEIPSKLSHFLVPKELKKKMNYTDNMIRISIGLEDLEDLINDLSQALNLIP